MQRFLDGLSQLEVKPLQGTAFRATQSRFLATPLSAIGSILTGGRYNPKGQFEVLYLAENPETTLKEVGFGSSVEGLFQASPTQPFLLLSVRLILQRVVDISTSESWKRLQTDADELTGSWREIQATGKIAPTQQIGIAARNFGLEALKIRAATDGKTNLAVFPDNLLKESFVEVYDPHQQLRGRLEGHK